MCTFTAEARELELHVDNTRPLNSAKHAVFRALASKLARGVYDPNLAPRAFKSMATYAARDYCRTYASQGDANRVFPNGAICQFCKNQAGLFESNIRQNMASDMPTAEAILNAIPGGAATALANRS